MELREAIEEVRGVMPTGYQWLDEDFVAENSPEEAGTLEAAYATILNAVADGTLIPADSVFQVREGYSVHVFNTARHDCPAVPLSEALEIRSADDVRREALEEAANVAFAEPWGSGKPRDIYYNIRALIDTPQPKGGDDELDAD